MCADHITRRGALTRTGLLIGAALGTKQFATPVLAANSVPAVASASQPFLYSLNMATIRGQKLGAVKEVQVAAEAGYDAIEPWISTIEEYVKAGGKLPELKQQISDLGLKVVGAIGFPEWMAEDEARRTKGLERAKYELELVAQIGGTRFAAPPAGATDVVGMELQKAADRYCALLEIGDQIGVIPQLEHWSFSKSLGRLSECVAAAMQCGHPQACVLADVFHLFKSRSSYNNLALLSRHAAAVVHLNDYPAEPTRENQNDSHRIYPGDGVAPMGEILRYLREAGGQRVLSLELFNRECWKQDPLVVAKTGLAKMKAVVARTAA